MRTEGPEIIYPVDDTLTRDNSFTFEWETLRNYKVYEIQIAKDKNFSEIVKYDKWIYTTLYRYFCDTESGTRFWRVCAKKGDRTAWSYAKFFVLPESPRPLYPPDGATVNSNDSSECYLKCDVPTYVMISHFEIDNNDGFSSPEIIDSMEIDTSGTHSTYCFYGKLGNGDYYWRASEKDSGSFFSNWSEVRKFTVQK
ncbi:hypothetical protein KAW65_04640 [candidate division WOR-3 bacterium]|nr:hypothetical protein [candidate division WOR-3 bacterium]